MAEQVHLHQESSLQELAQLLEHGIFSEKKVKEIVATREKFEYRLKRRGVLKDDYARYIGYEKQLDLEVREAVALGSHLNLKYVYFRRVIKLYQRAVAKFGHDIHLWLEFLEYSSTHATRLSFAKSMSRALKLHSRCSHFWILAANWEWGRNGNMAAARRLLQRGIQINPTEPDLYLALFKLELSFCEKMIERRSILGATSVPEEHHVLGGELANIVLRSATEVEGGITAREAAEYLAHAYQAGNFLPSLFPRTLSQIKELLTGGRMDSRSLGRYLLAYSKESVRVQLIVALLDSLQGDLDHGMVFAFTSTLLEISGSASTEETAQTISDRVRQLLHTAESKKLLSPDCYLLWIKNAELLGYKDEEVHDLIKRALLSSPGDQQLLFEAAALDVQKVFAPRHLNRLANLMGLLRDPSLKEKLSSLFLHKCLDGEFTNAGEAEAFIKQALTDPNFPLSTYPTPEFGKICSILGINRFRRLCEELIRCRVVGASLYESWITIEANQRECDLTKCRSIITKARVLFPNHTGILKAAYDFEKSLNNFTQAAKYAECARLCGAQI